jgi:hypothetical protein
MPASTGVCPNHPKSDFLSIFRQLLEEAAVRGIFKLEHDEKSGGIVVRRCRP